jgi:RimJ/RimL family protein N-acetyltransferase
MRYYVVGAPPGELGWYGVVGLTTIDWINRSAEVAVMMVNPDVEPDAVQLITDHAFRVLGLHRLSAETITPRRAAVFLAAGFRQEGESREAYWRDGQWVTALRWFRLSTLPASGPETPRDPCPG